jgi:tetratricopeptide (TPR) repeat protein
MKRITDKSNNFFTSLEAVLLTSFFFFLPLFQGSSNNTGIMLWQTIAFLLVVIRLTKHLFTDYRIKKIKSLDVIISVTVALAFAHLVLSTNRFESYILFTNIFFASLFYLFYLREKSIEEMKKLQVYFYPGFVFQIILGLIQIFTDPGSPIRGGFRDPNYFALYLIIGASLLLGTALFSSTKNRLRPVCFAVLPLIFILIITTKSRSGTGLFLLVLTIALFLRKPILSLIGIFIIVAVILIPNPYTQHIEEVHKTDPYAYTRINIYRMDLNIFSDHFALGTGLGCFGDFTPRYNFPVKGVVGQYRVTAKQAHNSFLHWTIEMGVTGLILLLMFISIILRNGLINLREMFGAKGKSSQYNPGAELALLAILSMSMIHNALYNNAIFLLFIFFIAYSGTFAGKVNGKKSDYSNLKYMREKKTAVHISIWFVIIGMIYYFLIFISWNSSRILDRAIERHSRKQYIEAVQDLNIVLKQIPFYTQARLLRGNIFKQGFSGNGNLDTAFLALQDFDTGLEYSPSNGELRIAKIHLLTGIKDLVRRNNPGVKLDDLDESIITSFEEILLTHPKKIFYLHDYAVFLRRGEKWEKAKQMLEKAVSLEPNYVSAHRLLALIYEHFSDADKQGYHREKVREIRSIYNIENYKHDLYLYNLLR